MEFSSSDICRIANVTKKALRHYNKLGLLSPSRIDTNGYWYYDDESLDKLQVIRNLQTIGFTLGEIKTNLENDCVQLRESIPDKLLYIDEQMMQLTLAKRLLKKIRAKGEASPMEAIRLSLEEEHLEWYETNLSTDQYRLIEELMAKPEGHELHNEMIRLIKSTKPLIQSDKKSDVIRTLEDIKAMFYAYWLDEDTVCYLLDVFIKSSLEGPLAQRILTVKESVYVLNLLNP